MYQFNISTETVKRLSGPHIVSSIYTVGDGGSSMKLSPAWMHPDPIVMAVHSTALQETATAIFTY